MRKSSSMKLCKIHGLVERYADGRCRECLNVRQRKKYARKRDLYKQRRDLRLQDPIYRRKQNDTKLRSSWKLKGLPTPTREVPVICECCGLAPKKKALALDHDHKTGNFRGWLCSECNFGIGKLGDSLDGIERARLYMLRAEFT